MPLRKFNFNWKTRIKEKQPDGSHILKQEHTGPLGTRILHAPNNNENSGNRTRRVDERDFPVVVMYDNPATDKPIWQIHTPDDTRRTFDRRSRAQIYLMGWFDNDTPHHGESVERTRTLLDDAETEYWAKKDREKELQNARI